MTEVAIYLTACLTAAALVYGVLMFAEAYNEYGKGCNDGLNNRPNSAVPHSFRPAQGHLGDLGQCDVCDFPEKHSIHHGGTK